MPVILRLRDVSGTAELRLREAIESALEGDWSVIVSRSHLDGQWHLQIQGSAESWRLVVPSFEDQALTELTSTLVRLSGSGQPELPFAPGHTPAPAADTASA